MKEYGVYGTPSFVVIDSQGNLIHKSIGASNKEEFLQFGKDALSDDRNYAVIKKQVENGNHSYELVKTYLDGNNPTSKMIIEREDLKKKNITDLNLYVESFNDIYTSYYYLLAYEINRKSREIYEESVKKSSKINDKTLNIAKKWVELLISYSSEEEYIDTYNKLVSQIKKIE